MSPARLAALSKDKRFLRRLSDAADDLADYLAQPRWYQEQTGVPRSIAYFSMEFGLAEVLPQYSGGLGILAGDHLKAASDLGVPIIGVGLLYRAGYFAQGLSRDGWQQELYPSIDPHGLPLSLVREADGSALRVSLGIPGGRTLRAQVWKVQVGRVPLLLLDSDIEENEASERQVTDKLYGGTSEHRMAQEMLAGVGGVRAVRAYCALTGTPAPEVFHTNEGHAGFLGVERMRELAAEGLSFDEALAGVRAGTVFTTHTPVPAGIDRFGKDLVRSYYTLPEWAALPVERVLELGAETDHGRVQHGAHGAAAGPARQRREQAARRGQPGDVPAAVAGLRRRGGADHLGDQRRARADLDVPRAAGDRRPERLGRAAAGRATAGTPLDKVHRRGAVGGPADAARAAGRRGPPPGARLPAAARLLRRRAGAGPRTSSTRTCSPSASPAGSRRTSG